MDAPSTDLEETHSSRMGPKIWRGLAVLLPSIVLLSVTVNPLLTAFLPYIHAGWPAVRTALWLKRVDPWKARGTVGLLFHLCMALLRAGTFASALVIITALIANITGQKPEMIPIAVALAIIFGGCVVSTTLGWIAIVIALRNRIPVWVKSDLYHVCGGDFAVAKSLPAGPVCFNAGTILVIITTIIPVLAVWTTVMIITAKDVKVNETDPLQTTLLILLPILLFCSLFFGHYFSSQMMAGSPAECWGAPVPTEDSDSATWYRLEE